MDCRSSPKILIASLSLEDNSEVAPYVPATIASLLSTQGLFYRNIQYRHDMFYPTSVPCTKWLFLPVIYMAHPQYPTPSLKPLDRQTPETPLQGSCTLRIQHLESNTTHSQKSIPSPLFRVIPCIPWFLPNPTLPCHSVYSVVLSPSAQPQHREHRTEERKRSEH